MYIFCIQLIRPFHQSYQPANSSDLSSTVLYSSGSSSSGSRANGCSRFVHSFVTFVSNGGMLYLLKEELNVEKSHTNVWCTPAVLFLLPPFSVIVIFWQTFLLSIFFLRTCVNCFGGRFSFYQFNDSISSATNVGTKYGRNVQNNYFVISYAVLFQVEMSLTAR